MNRRAFLRSVTLASSWGLLPAGLLGQKPPETLTFEVAGVRYYRLRHEPSAGGRIFIEAREFEGERCYAVCTADKEQLGWVPRRVVPLLHQREVRHARLSTANRYALPWKRYRVEAIVG